MPPHFTGSCLCMGITPNWISQPGHLQGLGLGDRRGNGWTGHRSGPRSKAQRPWSAAQLRSSLGQHPLSDPRQRLTAPPGGSRRDPARRALKRNEASLSDPKKLPWRRGGRESPCNAGDTGLTPGLGRSPGGANGNTLQYSCLENPTDRGAWRATVHGVPKSQTHGAHMKESKADPKGVKLAGLRCRSHQKASGKGANPGGRGGGQEGRDFSLQK